MVIKRITQEVQEASEKSHVSVTKVVPINDTSLLDRLAADNVKLKDLASSLEKTIDESKYEETT